MCLVEGTHSYHLRLPTKMVIESNRTTWVEGNLIKKDEIVKELSALYPAFKKKYYYNVSRKMHTAFEFKIDESAFTTP